MYNEHMETVIRNVGDLESTERLVFERFVGHPLGENQRVVIQVVTVGVQPSVEQRALALARLRQLMDQGQAHAKAQGIAEQEADQAIAEAIRHVRYGES
jgi:hypothetical protein